MVYFSRGRLPWQGLTAATKKQRYEKICEKKMSVTMDELCPADKVLAEIRLYLEYVAKLDFMERPDYALLRGMFLEALTEHGHVNDSNFDWLDPEKREEEQKE